VIQIIDQRYLPHRLVIEDVTTCDQMVRAIREMRVRGAPLIGVAAAYGVYLALRKISPSPRFQKQIEKAFQKLRQSRPTAVNLEKALEIQSKAIKKSASISEKIRIAFETANRLAEDEVAVCRKIGEHGLSLIQTISRRKKGETVNILTHCNAGWLACVEWGTATSPIYQAFDQGILLHVWVDETRPRNQGASLTAWELLQKGVPHTVIADNMAGHLMQRGKVDLVIVGTDRTLSTGYVANKIGTYLKALAAKDNKIPFYVALPSSSLDWHLKAPEEIPIEERSPDEVRYLTGLHEGKMTKVLILPEKSPAKNFAFDVTPPQLITGLITERGICEPRRKSIRNLFPENQSVSARDEGVVKFQCRWIPSKSLPPQKIKNLNRWRNRLFALGLIGVYEDGIGFGNISIRGGKPDQFIISGTQTGAAAKLNSKHYVEILDYDIQKNSLTCRGPVQASSESLTHAMLYNISPDTGAVIHVHSRQLWLRLLRRVPTTSKKVPYGTPAMAQEVKRLFRDSNLGRKKIFVMAGHEDGVVTFGKDLKEAARALFQFTGKQ
jgi:methylthioribose-1-phosphate isomerase